MIAHLAGRLNIAAGRLRRQRCEWCGVAIIEDDLARMMVAPGCEQDMMRGGFEPGTWVEVREGNPRFTGSLGASDRMPENSCMALECDALAPGARV